MKSYGTEFKVGLFTLLAFVAIGYMFFVLNPDSFRRKSVKTYYTVLEDAANIIERTHVKTNGVTIGKVTAVTLEVNQTRISLEVDGRVKIPVGSTIEIRTTGLLGDSHIEIVRVAESGQYIEDGGVIPLSTDKVGINQVISLVGAIAKDIKQITTSVSRVFGGDKGQVRVESIADNLQKFTEDIRGIVGDNRQDLRRIIGNLAQTSEDIRQVVGGNEQTLNETISNIGAASKALKNFAVAAQNILDEENRKKIEGILAKFDQSMDDIKSTTQNVKLVAERVEKGEGTLGRLINDDTAIQEVETTLKEIREVIAPARKLQVSVDVHGEFDRDGRAQQYFNIVFRTRPDRYYILGFTDVKKTVVETRTQQFPNEAGDESGDPEKTVERTITTERGLKFNFQFAKRWGVGALRMGLFESSGGFGADLFAIDDRFRLSLDAFNWGSRKDGDDRVATIRTYASILFYNHIYAMVGIESDGTSRKPIPYAGAGLNFDDDDIKGLFGVAALSR
jgi:phospholipid/cholesterol/gamma-HCH transport system substrate-binding protein